VLTYTAVVPPNTSATLYLPANSVDDIVDADGMESEGFENGKLIFNLGSGSYTFKSRI
jgi:hypothetical protein